jgi:xylose dehydrogenase (NAD/NADP)
MNSGKMTTKILNWGLLSTAHINRALIPAVRGSSRSRLAAVASRTQATAEAYAREWRIPQAHGSYEALLENAKIDVVYVSLPNHLHAEWAIRALRAGKHVLCEKPLALSVTEVDAMARAARDSGRVLAEAFLYRHHPQTLKVKELVDSGTVGSPQMIRGAFSFSLGRAQDIRLDKEKGGGSIWDVGCYPISFARMLAGAEPEEVFGWQILGPGGVDEMFVGQLLFPNKIMAQFDCSFRSPPRSFMEIVGSGGVLSVPMPFKPEVNERIVLQRGDRTETLKIKGTELYSGEVEDMADAVLEGRAPRISLADSRGNVAAIVGLIEAARTGKPVRI